MIPVFMNPNRFDVFEDALNDGFEKAGGGKSLDNFTVTPFCAINLMDDEAAARQPARENLALYIGGMGARDKNFYNDYAKRLGHEGAAVEIQDHFLAGRRAEALASVPDELIDQVALTGPAGKITERLQDWKSAAKDNKVHSLLARVSSSQVSGYENDEIAGGDDVYEQARLTFTKIKNLVEEAGAVMDDILKVTIFVTDISRREEVWKARREFFTGEFPCSTLVEVAALARPGLAVEIEAHGFIGASK